MAVAIKLSLILSVACCCYGCSTQLKEKNPKNIVHVDHINMKSMPYAVSENFHCNLQGTLVVSTYYLALNGCHG